jgi:hypothetical protein
MYARPQSEECQDRADGSVSAGQSKKVGATVGTTAAPCVLSPAFGGRGMGADDSTLNSVLNASFPVVLRKDLEIYSCAGSVGWELFGAINGD